MTVLALTLIMALATGTASCSADAVLLMADGSARVDAFDTAGGTDRMRRAADAGCREAEIAFLFLRGLADAREAFRHGGSTEALVPVRKAIAALHSMSRGQPGTAEIARLLLEAAAAASQSESDEMTLYLDAARRMELQGPAGTAGTLMLGSLAVAGDLWLQIYRYADARRAYLQALEEGRDTMRVRAGLARTAVRLGLAASACTNYRALLERWATRAPEPREIADARAYLGSSCARH